jgi:hypothetical protein
MAIGLSIAVVLILAGGAMTLASKTRRDNN